MKSLQPKLIGILIKHVVKKWRDVYPNDDGSNINVHCLMAGEEKLIKERGQITEK